MRIPLPIFIAFVYLVSGFLFADELINQQVNQLHSIVAESEKGTNDRVIVGDDPNWLFVQHQ